MIDTFRKNLRCAREAAMLFNKAMAGTPAAGHAEYLLELIMLAETPLEALEAPLQAFLDNDAEAMEEAMAAFVVPEDGHEKVAGEEAEEAAVVAIEDDYSVSLGLDPSWPGESGLPSAWTALKNGVEGRTVAFLTDPGDKPNEAGRLIQLRLGDQVQTGAIIGGDNIDATDLAAVVQFLAAAVVAGNLEIPTIRPELRAAVSARASRSITGQEA